MSWARNIQSRIQQQQQFGKPGAQVPPTPGDNTTNLTQRSPPVSSNSTNLTQRSPPLSGSTNLTQHSSNLTLTSLTNSGSVPLTNSITASTTTSTSTTATATTTIPTSNLTTSIIPPHLIPPIINNNINTTTTTTTTTASVTTQITSPIQLSTGIINPNVKPSALPSPSQSPLQTRNQAPPIITTTNTNNASQPPISPVTPQKSLNTPYQFPQKIVPKSLTTDMFKGADFSTITFVEDLTRKLVNDQMGSDGIHFEPSPFNSLFLNTQLQLSQLENNIDRKLDDLANECNDFSFDYKMKLQDLLGGYQECFQHFKKLEKGVNTIGTRAVHFGDELDSVNQQKTKAQGALSLINYLLELNNPGVANSSDNVTSSGNKKRSDIFTNQERIHELANLVKKLSSVSEDIKEISGFGQGKFETESLSNNLENDLINQFERAAERSDYDKMKQCATTLYNFNGGERCRARYIQKLKMFFDIDSLRKDENLANNTTKRQIRGNTILDTRFEIFYTEILRDVQHEQNVIQNVFINQTSAMSMLIVRLFEQRVHTFIETVLQLEIKNPSLFLQTVHYAYNSTKKLLVDPLTSYGIIGIDLNQLLNSIFYSYQEGYIKREYAYLRDTFHASVEEEIQRLQMLEQEYQYEEDGLNPEITQTFVQQTENALTRSYTLSPSDSALAENIKQIFFLMLEYLFEKYSNYVLEKYIVIPTNVSTPQDVLNCRDAISQLFRVVLSTNQIVGQIQTLFQVFVLPHIQTSMVVQSHCSDQLYYNINVLENNINIGLENSLNQMILLIDKSLLVDQKRNDYQLDENSTTTACVNVIKLVQSFYDMAKTNLQGKNFPVFLEELGLKLQLVLLNHFKKFKIGQPIGAIRLMKDLTEYRNCFKLFKSHKVDEAFELLFEISKLHLVNPDNLKLVIEGGALTRMPKQDLIIFIKQHQDFKSIWLDNL